MRVNTLADMKKSKKRLGQIISKMYKRNYTAIRSVVRKKSNKKNKILRGILSSHTVIYISRNNPKFVYVILTLSPFGADNRKSCILKGERLSPACDVNAPRNCDVRRNDVTRILWRNNFISLLKSFFVGIFNKNILKKFMNM